MQRRRLSDGAQGTAAHAEDAKECTEEKEGTAFLRHTNMQGELLAMVCMYVGPTPVNAYLQDQGYTDGKTLRYTVEGTCSASQRLMQSTMENGFAIKVVISARDTTQTIFPYRCQMIHMEKWLLYLRNHKHVLEMHVHGSELHREDGPAAIETDGTQWYYWKGKIHREDGPAVIEPNGRREYRQNGQFHREDGPAIIRSDGTQMYYQEGELHREDGPAVVFSDGSSLFYWMGRHVIQTKHAQLAAEQGGVHR